MKSKIIVTSGQTCNKFFSLLKPLHDAWVSDQRMPVLIPDKSLEDYDNLVNSRYLKFPLWYPKIAKFLGYKRYEDFIGRLYTYGLAKNPLFSASFKSRTFLESWNLRDFKVEGEFLSLVKDTFRPNSHIVNSVDREFSKYRNSAIIGVHIRRGDYNNFRNGIYYITDDIWVKIFEQLVEMFGKDVIFFISTNEKINRDNYAGFNIFLLEEIQGPSADLYGLSKCDYIIGPPSTYSNWAAVVGEKPLCFVRDKSNPIIEFNIPRNIW